MAVVRKIEAVVEEIIDHTDDVRTFILDPGGSIPRFKPGQFLHLAIDAYDPSRDWPESRVFSIASAPKADRIRVTISRKGQFTSRIFSDVRQGQTVWLKLPYGEFSFKNESAPLVLIAGGTGIAPFISLLEQSLIDKTGPKTVLHYGVRTSGHAIFEDILARCQNELDGFELVTWLEAGHAPGARQGVLDIEQIYKENSSGDSIFYLSGPWGMIDSFRSRLAELGVASDKIRIDAWE